MSVIAATHTVVNRKPRSPRHRFGQGILPSESVQPYSAEDLAWAAQALNEDSSVYVVTGVNHAALDDRAAEAAWYDTYAVAVPSERRCTGVSLDANEEVARRYNLSPEAEAEREADLAAWDAYQAQVSRWLAGRAPHPDTI
jgi:hypothetical protein